MFGENRSRMVRRESYASFFLVGNLQQVDDNNNGRQRERERNREDILITVEIFDILSKDEMNFCFSVLVAHI